MATTDPNASTRFLQQLFAGLQKVAYAYYQGKKNLDFARQQWQTAQTNVQNTAVDAHQKAMYLFLCLVLPAAYLMDYFLMGAVTEFFVGGFGYGTWLVELAKLAIPLAILLLEYYFALMRTHAQDQAEETSQRKPLYFWTTLGVLQCLMVPSLAIYTQWASGTASLLLVGVLGVFAFLIHAAVLFGGRQLHAAKTYILTRLSYHRRLRRVRKLEQQCVTLQHLLAQTFANYYQRCRAHNEKYPQAPLRPFPLDRVTQSVLTSLFEAEMLTPNLQQEEASSHYLR